MFKKNDPLVGAVQKIMAENAIRYQVEQKLCEELGIYSKNALPTEHKANYDALLDQRINEALHPNQQKLDVHEPEKDKLTAQDFKMLRSKKKEPQGADYAEKRRKDRLASNGRMDEEEQLDEISAQLARRAERAADDEAQYAADNGYGIRGAAYKAQAERLGAKADEKERKEKKAKQIASLSSGKRAKMKMEEEDTSSTDPDMAAPSKGPGYKDEIKPKTSEGPSASDRGALTNKIKSIMKEAKEKMELDEKAVSKSQQRFFGLVRGIQKGKAEGSQKAEKAAEEMSTKEVKKFAGTKLKGLPEKKKLTKESISFNSVMEEIRRKLGKAKMKEIEEEEDPNKPYQDGAMSQSDKATAKTQASSMASSAPPPTPAAKPEREPMKDLSGGADIAGGGVTGGNQAPEVSAAKPAPEPAAAPKIDVNKAISSVAIPAAPEIAAPTSQSIAKQAIKAPVQAAKGEGATGKALASSGIGKTERRSQEFVDKTLGAGKFKAGSAESNIALQKYSAGLQKAATPAGAPAAAAKPAAAAAKPAAAAPATPAAKPAAAAPAAKPAAAAPSAVSAPKAPTPGAGAASSMAPAGFKPSAPAAPAPAAPAARAPAPINPGAEARANIGDNSLGGGDTDERAGKPIAPAAKPTGRLGFGPGGKKVAMRESLESTIKNILRG